MNSDSNPPRRPWQEGPEGDAPGESWLALSDDELLHRLQGLDLGQDVDQRLLEIVASDRHFFVRQESAKRIRRRKLLFPFEDDKHIGQILVRHLNRREDLTYLERLVARSRYAEVRKAAQVQLARLRKRLGDADRRDAGAVNATSRPWRIAVVHADRGLRSLVAETLGTSEFEVASHDPGEAAVAAMMGFGPDLVLAGIDDVPGEAGLLAAIRAGERYVPVVVLCQSEASERICEVIAQGADEFMLLPLAPALLVAKTRALLHLANLTASRSARRKASGPIGHEGVLPLLRLCEEEHLTCRLVVVAEGARWFADFAHGDLTEAGGAPPLDDDAALAAMLAVRSGTYEILEIAFPEVEVDGGDAAEVDVPHIVSVPAGPSGQEAAALDGVDATLLGWAIHFIVEQVWACLGTAATTGLLKRTLRELADQHPTLRVFSVEDNAHVSVDLTEGPRLHASAVASTARWMAEFLAATRRVAPDATAIDVREATHLVAAALEHVDFYVAFELASGVEPKLPALPIARIMPTRRPG